MLDIGSILYNLKYRDGIKLVSEKEYVKKIALSRDTESSGMEYICAQKNKVNDYNETARELLTLYH